MSDWTESTVEKICSVVTDGSHFSPVAVDHGHYMVSVKDFEQYGFNFSDCKQISEEDYQKLKSAGCVPEKQDILIGKDGARYFEDIIVYEQEEKPALLSSIAILRCNQDIIRPYFLYYYMRTPSIQKDVKDNYGSGSAIPRIVLKDFKRMPVYYPSLPEQDRIVAVLKIIDDKIKTNSRINKNLAEQAKQVFYEEFLGFKDVPVGWRESSLIGIADYQNGLAMQRFRPIENDLGLPVLKIKELREGRCDSSSERCRSDIDSKYIVYDGDVIFSWSGSLLVDFWCGSICGLNQHLFKVTSIKYDKWFYYSWTLYYLDEFIEIAADKATTMGHIKRDSLEKAKVLIPPMEEYNRIGSVLGPIYDLIIRNRIENRELSRLRDDLLPKLMNGEIDVSEISVNE